MTNFEDFLELLGDANLIAYLRRHLQSIANHDRSEERKEKAAYFLSLSEPIYKRSLPACQAQLREIERYQRD